MRKAAGILAIISGGIGLLGAGVALLSLFAESIQPDEVVPLFFWGLGTLFFALSALVLGAAILNSRSNVPGILLIALSILGMVFGAWIIYIAPFMIVPLVAGVMAVRAARQSAKPPPMVREVGEAAG